MGFNIHTIWWWNSKTLKEIFGVIFLRSTGADTATAATTAAATAALFFMIVTFWSWRSGRWPPWVWVWIWVWVWNRVVLLWSKIGQGCNHISYNGSHVGLILDTHGCNRKSLKQTPRWVLALKWWIRYLTKLSSVFKQRSCLNNNITKKGIKIRFTILLFTCFWCDVTWDFK